MPALGDFEVEVEAPVAERTELYSVLRRLEKLRIRVAETKELIPVRQSEAWDWVRDTSWPMWSTAGLS